MEYQLNKWKHQDWHKGTRHCSREVRQKLFGERVVERSNAWIERCKSLTKNFERTLVNAKAKMDLCFVRLMLKRVAADP